MDHTGRGGFSDFFVVLFYGLALSYTHNFLYPLSSIQLAIGSGLLAFALGTFGPALEEILEWIIAFGFGVTLALLTPQILHYYKTGFYDWGSIIEISLSAIPFTLTLLTPWVVCLPVGYGIYKISHRNYYRHARFF